MNFKFLLYGFCFSAILCAPCLSDAQQLVEIEDFGNNPGNLSCFLSASQKKDTTAHPLVIVLHGCNQNAPVIFKESGWDRLSARYGFHVLCPEQKRINNVSRCFNWFLKQDNSGDSGEMASLLSMLQYTKKKLNIDTSRIFIYGVSAGAFMAVAFSANFPQWIKAAAICAGGPFSQEHRLLKQSDFAPAEWSSKVRTLNPEYEGKYPRLIVFHGTKDKVVQPEYASELCEQWTDLHGIPLANALRDTVTRGKLTVYQTVYRNSLNDTLVQLMLIRGLGHALSVDPGEGTLQGGKTSLFAVDQNWFSTYEIMRWFGIN